MFLTIYGVEKSQCDRSTFIITVWRKKTNISISRNCSDINFIVPTDEFVEIPSFYITSVLHFCAFPIFRKICMLNNLVLSRDYHKNRHQLEFLVQIPKPVGKMIPVPGFQVNRMKTSKLELGPISLQKQIMTSDLRQSCGVIIIIMMGTGS